MKLQKKERKSSLAFTSFLMSDFQERRCWRQQRDDVRKMSSFSTLIHPHPSVQHFYTFTHITIVAACCDVSNGQYLRIKQSFLCSISTRNLISTFPALVHFVTQEGSVVKNWSWFASSTSMCGRLGLVMCV